MNGMPREVSAGSPGQYRSSEIWRAISLLREASVAAADEGRVALSERCSVAAGRLEHNMRQAQFALEDQQNLVSFYSGNEIHQSYLDGMVVVLRILDDSRSAPQQRPPYQRF